jgi:signal transduction histidine kinase
MTGMTGKKKHTPLNIPIFVKICVFFLLLMTLTAIPLFFLAARGVKEFGHFSDVTNTRQIREMTDTYLTTMALEKAQKFDQFFSGIQASAAFVALKAQEIYRHMDTSASVHTKPPHMTLNPENNIFYTPESEPLITAFWADTTISPQISAEIHALSRLDPFLLHAQKVSGRSLAAHIITATGIGKYYTKDPRARQRCFDLPSPDEFDLRDGEPVTTFTSQAKPDYRPRWTRIYKDDVIDGLMMTATAPVVDDDGRFRGIAGIDIPLDNIIRDLMKDHPYRTEVSPPDACCFSFFMTPAGELVSFPFSFLSLFGLDVNTDRFKYSSDVLSLKLTDSGIPGVQKAAAIIADNPDNPFTIDIGSRTYVMASQRLSQTGWYIVLVSSEEQFLSSIRQTRQAMAGTLSEILNDFLLFTAVILVVAAGFIYGAVRLFLAPIRQLTRLTRKVSQKDYDYSYTAPVTGRLDEIGELSRSFNQMVRQLANSRKREKAHTESLSRRTAQLRYLNEHLVNCEEIQRKTIASDLHDSIAQTLAMGISKIKNITESGTTLHPEDFEDIQLILEQALREIRSLIYKLSPPILDDFDIDIAIGFLIEETNARQKTQYHYINHVKNPVPMRHAIKVTLYRAVNELLTNIRKHANTRKAQIQLSVQDQQILLQVEDRGIGMDVEKVSTMPGCGFGIYSLCERIQNFGGTMDIASAHGKGTNITITIPITLEESIHEKTHAHHCG